MTACEMETPTEVARKYTPIAERSAVSSAPATPRRAKAIETPGVFSAAAKSVEFSDRLRNHQRETRRLACEIPCSVEIVLMDGTVFDSGSATLMNISPSGALIAGFDMQAGTLPGEQFKVRLVLEGDPYSGIGIEATPGRLAIGTFALGVKFDEIFVAV